VSTPATPSAPEAPRTAGAVLAAIVQLQDLDLLIAEAADPAARARLRKLGFAIDDPAGLEAERTRLAATIERRWLSTYERARQRYGRAVAAVRDRVCSGCFVTLPTTARPRGGGEESPGICESCGRILYWS